jgi:hypothetical protein
MRHTNSTFALGGIDHCFFRCGLRVFFQNSPHRLVGDLLHDLQFHQPICQKPQAPASLPFRWLTTGKGEKPCLLLPVQLPVVLPVRGTSVESCLKAFLKVLLTHLGHGRLAHLHRLGNHLVHPAWSPGL